VVAEKCFLTSSSLSNPSWRNIAITFIENRSPLLPSDDPQKHLGANEFGEQFFLFQKLSRMHASPAPPQLDWVLQMQHLVEEDVFDSIARHAWVVEDAADDDGVVCRVIVPEAAAGVVPAPGKLRAAQESVEEAPVEVVENFFQMVVMAAGGADVLASAHLADEASLGGNVVAGDIAAITGAVGAIDRLTIKLGEQDVGD